MGIGQEFHEAMGFAMTPELYCPPEGFDQVAEGAAVLTQFDFVNNKVLFRGSIVGKIEFDELTEKFHAVTEARCKNKFKNIVIQNPFDTKDECMVWISQHFARLMSFYRRED